MAVVFISPKQRQKMFITGITIVVGLFLLVIASIVFFSQPKEVSPTLVFNKPKVTIDFNVFDSDEFKNLQPVSEMKIQFVYQATKDEKEINGYIAATSRDDAGKILEELGYNVLKIEEAKIGRSNPFEPYNTTTETSSTENLQATEE